MTKPPEGYGRYRPMTVGEVARIAGVPRETLRKWLRSDVFKKVMPPEGGGWRRFTDFEAMLVGVYARLIECDLGHDAAHVGMGVFGKWLMDEWIEVEGVPYYSDATFQKNRFLFFWRNSDGQWSAEDVEMGDEFNAKMNARLDETYSGGPAFSVINLGVILKRCQLALLDVQLEKAAKLEKGAK